METSLEPTQSTERIAFLDSMRGIAVLGILLMNITGFGLPNAYDNPTNWGGAEGANLFVWRAMSLFFEGTMRGLFTLLFGAGVLLFLERHARRNAGLQPADLYFRRTLWLIVFGLVNGYVFLWDGDILFYYGVTGLVLFVFRNQSTGGLIISAVFALLLQTAVPLAEWAGFERVREQAELAQTAQQRGEPLTEEQQTAIETFKSVQSEFKPPEEQQEEFIADVQESYLSALFTIAPRTWYVQTNFFFRHGLLESLGMMLLGMALFRLGVMTGAASVRTYVSLAAVGYAIGLPVNAIEIMRLEAAGFSPEAMVESYVTYHLGRIPTTLGHIGLIGLIFHAGVMRRSMRVLAAVGQMALSNYLAQSVICMFVFTGAGLALFGELERFELYYVVLAIWVAQLVWSPLWLKYYRFGPVEWLWRSLTYWQRQPLRRYSPEPASLTQNSL